MNRRTRYTVTSELPFGRNRKEIEDISFLGGTLSKAKQVRVSVSRRWLMYECDYDYSQVRIENKKHKKRFLECILREMKFGFCRRSLVREGHHIFRYDDEQCHRGTESVTGQKKKQKKIRKRKKSVREFVPLFYVMYIKNGANETECV